MAKTGYMNGSDMLLALGSGATVKCFGHCSTHSVSMSSETKERAVKPLLTAAITAGLWKGKGVTGLSVSISSDGLIFYDESEFSYAELVAIWKTGQPINVKCFERNETGGSTTPAAYLSGSFIISSLEMNAAAQDDATYSITLENNGEVTIDETKLTKLVSGSAGA